MNHKSLLIALTALFVFAAAVALDAFWIEPYWIEVTHHHVFAPLASPLKIAHLTDIHTRGLGRRERRMLALLESERPDLIVITGDTVSNGGFDDIFRETPRHLKQVRPKTHGQRLARENEGRYEMCREVLKRLHAPLGVSLVRGNWEHWWLVGDEREFYESVGINFLLNAGRRVRDDIWILGFDDAVVGSPSLEAALVGVPPGAFKIALFHSPAYFGRVAGQCNLAFAGHTQGARCDCPFSGRFGYRPVVEDSWRDGMSRVGRECMSAGALGHPVLTCDSFAGRSWQSSRWEGRSICVSEMAHLENGIIGWSTLTGPNRFITEINEACCRVLGVETRHKEASCPG